LKIPSGDYARRPGSLKAKLGEFHPAAEVKYSSHIMKLHELKRVIKSLSQEWVFPKFS
jgi:hypothetical protein